MQPAGETMLGVSRTVKNGRTVAFEYMQIKTGAIGQLVFVASPSGQKETTFTVSFFSKSKLVFENLQHDFPQRISYEAVSDGKLQARIEGKRGDSVRAIDFHFTRVECKNL